MELETPRTFRDRPININEQGQRKWIYAKKPKGEWYTRRTIVAWLAIAFLAFAPFLKINGNPLMLFDIANRKFSLFGQLIWAQDSYLLSLIMATTVVFIVLFTVVFGRVWCGWACPQTIFLEMVYRRIEYLFEGDYRNGKPKEHEMTTRIFSLKLAKHAVFFLISIVITNIFLNWIIGPDQLWGIISGPIHDHLFGFLAMIVLSLFYYWIYAFFREQVCTMICPYGRLQGALLDSKSIGVIYDYKRGEPRGAKSSGDCINCHQCVSVCPTGIDIKNGSQLECIQCTACIDECNIVMKRIGKPKNLIRFDSVYGIKTGKRSILNARTYAYSAVLAILVVVLSVTIVNRKPIEITMLRVSGSIYQQVDSVNYSNLYMLKIINKTEGEKTLTLKLINPKSGTLQLATGQTKLKAQELLESILIVNLNRNSLTGKSTNVELGIYEGEELLGTYMTNFLGPIN
jgi:cytochrome c oxidase accessory protein FixG